MAHLLSPLQQQIFDALVHRSLNFNGDSLAEACPLLTVKWTYVLLSNIYRWRICLWNVSWALRIAAHLKRIKQRKYLSVSQQQYLSEHLTGQAALNLLTIS